MFGLHYRLERKAIGLVLGIVGVASIGGLVEIAPLFTIHQTAADVEDEAEFADLWPGLSRHLEGKILVAHNAEFDITVLRSILDRYRIPRPTVDYSCSKIIAQRTWPGLGRYGLAALAAAMVLAVTRVSFRRPAPRHAANSSVAAAPPPSTPAERHE